MSNLVHDLAECARVEAALRENVRRLQTAEAKFRTLVESAPDAIVIVDGTGCITLINRQAEEMFGYQREELLGQPVEVLVPEASRGVHAQHRARYAGAPTTRPMGAGLELHGRCKDGSTIPVEISLSPVETAGEVLVASVIRDVTEKRDLEKAKDEFFGNVSHDLRTPLAAIKASIGVVLANEPPDTPEPLHRMFVNIDLAADRMAKLVGDLLELTRLQAGRGELRADHCDLRTLALRSARAIEPLAQARGQRLELDLPPQLVPALADAERLEHALLNLLGNAQKYGRPGGKIGLRLEQHGDAVTFAVTDDGPGIAEADQKRLFERFYRPETEATRQNQGSGLGLAIARAMVELHGGRLGVQSSPGAGSTFTIELPTHPPGLGNEEDEPA